MKKSKLIKLLESIEGDPDIVLWNGFVGDYQDISKEFVEDRLVKDTLDGYIKRVQYERARRKDDFSLMDIPLSEEELTELKNKYKKFTWEHNEYVTDDLITSKMYKQKRVVFLQPKLRGVETWDRLGTISY